MILSLLSSTEFSDISSASGIEYHNGHFYIAGDDASRIYCLDDHFALVNSIHIPGPDQYRIPKKEKKDWESLAVVETDGREVLLLLGSGSLSPQRDYAAIWDFGQESPSLLDLGPFYTQLRNDGLMELNIEGATAFGKGILLGSRGHKLHPHNTLIYSPMAELWKAPSELHYCELLLPEEAFVGISGLAWWAEKDWLFFTASSEDTANVYDDGLIGESRVGWIRNASSALLKSTVQPDEWIKLEEIAPVFMKKKIESICVRETANTPELILVADNDDGSSHLFRLLMEI
ncbi:hypothetical protein GFS24_04720 [Chitinophaga sp. SYP-B3965]|uniref:DUF6929 family protein n=1 Tax=Chitinophaga sp. SYP-B3965 TaxID=2663120 RepID=UPI001299CFFC|nr:hypothetical protein [Chitinophaga sp. SYP-B3965]MRG44403.1 hypothetical protein [Chitinophaga sp. SYP-B3965]